MLLRLIAGSLLCLQASCVFAQVDFRWKESSAAGHKYRYVTGDPLRARFYTLKNGLTVILSVNNKQPRIQTLMGVRSGSNSDPKEHTGLAHYLEHLLFKGTDSYGSLDPAKEKVYIDRIEQLYEQYGKTTDPLLRTAIYHEIDSVSGIAAKYAIPNEYSKMMSMIGSKGTNAYTTVEETVYKEDIPAHALDRYLAIQAERFRNPVFRLFHTELEAVYEEKNIALGKDQNRVWETMMSAVFPTHNYGQQTTLGTTAHLKNPSLTAIREFYNTHYVPNNMVLVMTGDLDPDEAILKIARAFGYMVPKPLKEYKGPVELPIQAPVEKEVTGPDPESVMLTFRLPGAADITSGAIRQVILQLLSNGKTGLIDVNLLKQQKVLHAGAFEYPLRDYSLLMLFGVGRGQSPGQLKDILLSQIDLLRKGAFDDLMIKSIVSNYKLSLLNSFDDNMERASVLLKSFMADRCSGWDKTVGITAHMSVLTRSDIMKYMNQYAGENNYVAVYKKQGYAGDLVKVEKPVITPVSINRDTSSLFLRRIAGMPAPTGKPHWTDYHKQISKANIGPAEVLYVQNKDNDLFRLHYQFDMGKWNKKELEIAAAYLGFLGTDSLTGQQISQSFYNLACNFEINTGTDNMTITITGLEENFTRAVSLFEDLIRNCRGNKVALENMKTGLLKARTDKRSSKQSIAEGLRQYAIYGSRNPFNTQLSASSIQALDSGQLVSFLHELFGYEHRVIYYGPQPLPSFLARIKPLHPLPASLKPVPAPALFEKQTIKNNIVLFFPYEMAQAEISWINNGNKYNVDNSALIDLFNNYFGRGMESLVFQTIRESKALAYSANAVYESPATRDGRYSLLAYVGTQVDKLKDAAAAMDQLLESLPESETALTAIKENMRKSLASSRLSQDAVVFDYLRAKKLGINEDIRKVVYNKIDDVTFNELEKFHRQNISGKPYIYTVLGPSGKIDPGDLKRLGDVKQLTPEELFGY